MRPAHPSEVKLPDAIVAASAVLSQVVLVTNDAQLLKLAAEDSSYAALTFNMKVAAGNKRQIQIWSFQRSDGF